MRLLILGGISEARQLAAIAAREPGVVVTVSLAGQDCRPISYGVPTRIGGFGGRDEFRDFLENEGVDAVLDATHPFATSISHRTLEVCTELGLAHAQFLRRPWLPAEGDSWTFLNTASDLIEHVKPKETVFIGSGTADLFALEKLKAKAVWCRTKKEPDVDFPLPNGGFLTDLPPFTVAQEMRLLKRLRVDWVLARNSGGQGSWPKIEAARNLGIRVAVIRRPLQPEAVKLETMAEATAWIRRRH